MPTTAFRSAPLLILCSLLSTMVAPTAALSQVVEQPVPADPARIDSGLVAGKQLASGVRAWLGIPFAAPPVRELRWRAPQPVTPWKGTYSAVRKPTSCMQSRRISDANHYFGDEPMGEDCLYLNVWAPPVPAAATTTTAPAAPNVKWPVVVWIHGGAFLNGSTSMPLYDGENLARKGVLFVSINYRLGALGYMAHPEATRESTTHASGNYGSLDQVAALRWIQKNIAAFGGDPANVTVMGQSAGSMSVHTLMASPLTVGLFHRAMGMSGTVGSTGAFAIPLRDGEQQGLKFQAAIGAQSLAELRKLPADRILEMQNECATGCPDALTTPGIIDGYFLTEAVPATFEKGRQRDVPLLVGFTRDEAWNDLMTANTPSEFTALAQQRYGDKATAFLKLYTAETEEDFPALRNQAVRDSGLALATRTWARSHKTSAKSPVYVYEYSQRHPYTPGVTFADLNPQTVGAYHSSELPYFFNNLAAMNVIRPTRNWTAADNQLAERISSAIATFARTGSPNSRETPWLPYEKTRERYIELGETIQVTTFNTKRMDFMAANRKPTSLSAPRQPLPAASALSR